MYNSLPVMDKLDLKIDHSFAQSGLGTGIDNIKYVINLTRNLDVLDIANN